jgi:hypothetical protein
VFHTSYLSNGCLEQSLHGSLSASPDSVELERPPHRFPRLSNALQGVTCLPSKNPVLLRDTLPVDSSSADGEC